VQTRSLGADLTVSAQGLGCMGMSRIYGPADEDDARGALRRALDLGVTLFDTADVYGGGHNEELLGSALGRRRAEIVLSTKFGFRADGDRRIDGRPDYVRAACDASLKRLGSDHIDIYYPHRLDPATPIEATVGAIADLIRDGKVRFIGLSEASAADIRRAHEIHPITAVQSEWSLWTRDPEVDDVLATTRELGIGFIAFSPLGRGFLSGELRSPDDLAPDDLRRSNPRFQDENFARNLDLVDRVRQLALTRRCSPAQVALAWVLSRGDDVVPIPGSKRAHHVEANVRAGDIELDAAELAWLDHVFAPGAAAGERYAGALRQQWTTTGERS
jgi:aryl-alcohol dehydrogenase-like predicted oxidoreductase